MRQLRASERQVAAKGIGPAPSSLRPPHISLNLLAARSAPPGHFRPEPRDAAGPPRACSNAHVGVRF